MIIERMPLLIKRLNACLSIYISGYEECYKDLFVYCIYGALNNVQHRDGQNVWKIYTIRAIKLTNKKINGEINKNVDYI
jgi:hypothetical protein